jgi:hypothetical protein
MVLEGVMNKLVVSILLSGGLSCAAVAQQNNAPSYPAMAPVEQYRIADPQAEIALARSAAPASISADASVLVLGQHGYETAVKGKNGFVCFVERSWNAPFDDPEFWNPKRRGPDCLNAQAARSVLPQFLKRTEWVLAGADKPQLIERARAAFADHSFTAPEPGAFAYMLSKQGYLSDQAEGPWLPHVMLFVPRGQAAAWGAGLEGSPVMTQDAGALSPTVLFIPVRRWSDGSPAPPASDQSHHNM